MAGKTYKLVNGRVKVQIEDIMGKNPGNGWVYQAPGVGNPGAEGAHYYYRTQTGEGTHKPVSPNGRFSFQVDVEDPGTYRILLRASRDVQNPGDARNDIWIRVDGNTQEAAPNGTPKFESGGQGFVKYKGAWGNGWVLAHQFPTAKHGDVNPDSAVVFDKGIHTIDFAARSFGYHIDSVQIVKKGKAASKSQAVEAEEVEVAGTGGDTEVGAKADVRVKIAARHDDFESNKAGASDDLELGLEGGKAQSVGLRFAKLDLEELDIKHAYFVFTADENSKGRARFEIEVEDSAAARTYSKANGPDDRDYLDETVRWNPGDWKKGETYKSADIAKLIEAVIEEEGAEALDALAFRITGSGSRVAESFEAKGGGAPELVIDYA